MRLPVRCLAALIALGTCLWASATMVRHFAGTPDRVLTWLFLAPPLACLLSLIGLGLERAQADLYPNREVPSWRQVLPLALVLQYAGLALLAWRAVWMFFSWDGLFYFPACLALALALYRYHPRWLPAA